MRIRGEFLVIFIGTSQNFRDIFRISSLYIYCGRNGKFYLASRFYCEINTKHFLPHHTAINRIIQTRKFQNAQ